MCVSTTFGLLQYTVFCTASISTCDIQSTNVITSIMIRTMCFVFLKRLSLCSPGWLGTRCTDRAGLDLAAIFLPLQWGQGMPPCLGHVLSSLNITSSEGRMNSKGRVPNLRPLLDELGLGYTLAPIYAAHCQLRELPKPRYPLGRLRSLTWEQTKLIAWLEIKNIAEAGGAPHPRFQHSGDWGGRIAMSVESAWETYEVWG